MRKVLLVLLIAVVLFPFVWAVSASFFGINDFTRIPPSFFPAEPTVSNYQKVFQAGMGHYLVNSLIVALEGTVIRLVITLLAAYSLTVFHFPGRNALLIFLISTMLFPGDALLLQNYLSVSRMGLCDSYTGMIITSVMAPAALFLLVQFFRTVSPEYRQAAYLEGCGDIYFIIHFLIPMSQSVLTAISIQAFTGYFNAYLWPLLVTNREGMRTIQIALTATGWTEYFDYGPLFAAIVLLSLPMVAATFFMRNKIMDAIGTRFTGR